MQPQPLTAMDRILFVVLSLGMLVFYSITRSTWLLFQGIRYVEAIESADPTITAIPAHILYGYLGQVFDYVLNVIGYSSNVYQALQILSMVAASATVACKNGILCQQCIINTNVRGSS